MQQTFQLSGNELRHISKGTNSLSTSPTSCHSCQRLRIPCDRQRPKCQSCMRVILWPQESLLTKTFDLGIKAERGCGFNLDIRWTHTKRGRPKSKPQAWQLQLEAKPAVQYSPSDTAAFRSPKVAEAFCYFRCNFAEPNEHSPASSLSSLRLLVPLVSEFEPLQHAIALLSATHRQCGTTERMSLRGEALKGLCDNLVSSKPQLILATILVLLSSESVESGYGAWRTHLLGVKKVLDGMYKVEKGSICLRDQLERAFIFQFYWWDTMGALLSIQEPVLPSALLKMAINTNKAQDISQHHNSLYDQFGCSEEIFEAMNQLAHGDKTFDDINAASTTNSLGLDQQTEPTERMHLERIWMSGLATYAFLRSPPYPAPPAQYRHNARVVFKHASRLDPKSTLRKKILFPLIMACSDSSDPEIRSFLEHYCLTCFEETKFGYFKLGLDISRKVAALRENEVRDRRAISGLAYSCWRNVTATAAASHAMLA